MKIQSCILACAVLTVLSFGTKAQETFTIGNSTLYATDLVTDSQIPWEILWGGDDMLWCSERKGRVLRIDPATGEYTTVLDLNVTFNGNGEPGLLGMVQHPDFPTDPRVWVVYCDGQFSVSEHLSVFEWDGTALVNEEELLTLPGAQIHNGSRLMWLPDNTMLMTTGDAGETDNSQDLESLNGKILRLNPDGTVPADNPWPDSYVYTWGNRNPQGLPQSMDRTPMMSSTSSRPAGITDGPTCRAPAIRLPRMPFAPNGMSWSRSPPGPHALRSTDWSTTRMTPFQNCRAKS